MHSPYSDRLELPTFVQAPKESILEVHSLLPDPSTLQNRIFAPRLNWVYLKVETTPGSEQNEVKSNFRNWYGV